MNDSFLNVLLNSLMMESLMRGDVSMSLSYSSLEYRSISLTCNRSSGFL